MKRQQFFIFMLLMASFVFLSCSQNSKETISDNTPVISDEDITHSNHIVYKYSMPSNVQRWPMISTNQKKCYDNKKEIKCPLPGEAFYGQDATFKRGFRSYVSSSEDTVKDLVTGLVWEKGYKSKLTWYEAKSYCDNLSKDEFVWRLPTTHELKSIVDYGKFNPAINTSYFPDTPGDWLWASQTERYKDPSGNKDAAWIINFYDGFIDYSSKTNRYNVRCVKAN